MSSQIARDSRTEAVALTAVLATTPQIDKRRFAGGTIFIPAGSPITTLTYHAAPTKDGTYLPLYDKAGNAVTQTVAAGRAREMPDAIFGVPCLKIVVDVAGAADIGWVT